MPLSLSHQRSGTPEHTNETPFPDAQHLTWNLDEFAELHPPTQDHTLPPWIQTLTQADTSRLLQGIDHVNKYSSAMRRSAFTSLLGKNVPFLSDTTTATLIETLSRSSSAVVADLRAWIQRHGHDELPETEKLYVKKPSIIRTREHTLIEENLRAIINQHFDHTEKPRLQRTLLDVGAWDGGVTRERVRQYEAIAMRKIMKFEHPYERGLIMQQADFEKLEQPIPYDWENPEIVWDAQNENSKHSGTNDTEHEKTMHIALPQILSTKISNALAENGVYLVQDLVNTPLRNLKETLNLGEDSIHAIFDALRRLGAPHPEDMSPNAPLDSVDPTGQRRSALTVKANTVANECAKRITLKERYSDRLIFAPIDSQAAEEIQELVESLSDREVQRIPEEKGKTLRWYAALAATGKNHLEYGYDYEPFEKRSRSPASAHSEEVSLV